VVERRAQPTILDVAELAGVSKLTVSNVVRGSTGISHGTKPRVPVAHQPAGYRQ